MSIPGYLEEDLPFEKKFLGEAVTVSRHTDTKSKQTITYKYVNSVDTGTHSLCDAIPSCVHELYSNYFDGVKCAKCGGHSF